MSEARGPWLRLVWVVAVGLPLLISVASWPPYIQLVLRPCPSCPLTPAMASTLRAAGLGPAQWAALSLALSLAGPLAWGGVGLLVFLRRRTPEGLFSFVGREFFVDLLVRLPGIERRLPGLHF